MDLPYWAYFLIVTVAFQTGFWWRKFLDWANRRLLPSRTFYYSCDQCRFNAWSNSRAGINDVTRHHQARHTLEGHI